MSHSTLIMIWLFKMSHDTVEITMIQLYNDTTLFGLWVQFELGRARGEGLILDQFNLTTYTIA